MALALYAVSGITAAETGVCSTFYPHGTPAEGTVRIPVFLVEFPDAAFRPDRLSDDEVEQMLFDPDDAASMAAFERAASNGRLRVEGDVFSYTVRQDSTDYQDESGSFEKLAMEVLAALDGEIDYRDYDSDGDGYLDAFVLNIAQGDQDPYWFGCQTYWNENPDFAVDGVRPFNYIINDAQPDADGWSMDYYVSVLCHEFGHCLGLPDYYYLDLNAEETSDEADGLKGAAGLRRGRISADLRAAGRGLPDPAPRRNGQPGKAALGRIFSGGIQYGRRKPFLVCRRGFRRAHFPCQRGNRALRRRHAGLYL